MVDRIVVEYIMERRLAICRLDNPERKNAISAVMWNQIGEFAVQVGANEDLRAVIISGSSDTFSAGADIGDFEAFRSVSSGFQSYDDLVEFTCQKVEAIPLPTICAIEGPCLGAGLSLACSCDLRVASEEASFAVPAARIGLGYDIRGIARLRRIFGHAATAALLLTADSLSARAASLSGAVHTLSVPHVVEPTSLALADCIAANAPITLHAAKLSLLALALDDDGLRQRAAELSARADESDDYREGRAAFLDRRSPVFNGR